jgi:hypothetical protein
MKKNLLASFAVAGHPSGSRAATGGEDILHEFSGQIKSLF